MKKVFGTIVIVIVGMAVIIGSLVYYYWGASCFQPVKKTYIYIDRDDTTDSVFNKVKAVSTGNVSGFHWLAKWDNLEEHIHTGRYPIHSGDNVYQVYKRIAHGLQEPINLTIGSVRTLDKMARSLSRQLMLDSVEIADVLLDSTVQVRLGYTKETIPCLFIPNTYQVYWDISADELLERMQKEHKRFWNEERLAKAKSIGMTPGQVCTLASIVDEETNNDAEKTMVAGLYINRLHTGMPLQADPTIKFALQDFSLRRITNRHTRVASPYNTYINLGLPPGPIRIASIKGIESVLNYTHHNYIYMCAKEDFSGTHNFAATYSEHMENARKYWKALNRRQIYK